MEKRTWGSDVIPKDQWIDHHKKYTCEGCEVQHLSINLRGLCDSDREVTYPVHGIIIRKMGKKDRTWVSKSWTLNGKHSIVFEEHLYDLVEVKEKK